MAVAILVLHSAELTVQARVDIKQVRAVLDIAVERKHILMEVQ